MKIIGRRWIMVLGAIVMSLPASLLAEEEEKKSVKRGDDLVAIRLNYRDEDHWVTIRLDDASAPEHCANFRKLAKESFYDGMLVHRTISGYLVQTGDPLTRDESQKELWGTGGPGYNLPEETGLSHQRGTVGMARRRTGNPEKVSSGSQFYIMLRSAPELDGQYTAFGKVVEGLDVVDRMSRSRTDTNDLPIRSIQVTDSRVGEPSLLANMTPKMPDVGLPDVNIPNPLAVIPNPFSKGDDDEPDPAPAGEDTGEWIDEQDLEVAKRDGGSVPTAPIETADARSDAPIPETNPETGAQKSGALGGLLKNPFAKKSESDAEFPSATAETAAASQPQPAPEPKTDGPDPASSNIDLDDADKKSFFHNPFAKEKGAAASATVPVDDGEWIDESDLDVAKTETAPREVAPPPSRPDHSDTSRFRNPFANREPAPESGEAATPAETPPVRESESDAGGGGFFKNPFAKKSAPKPDPAVTGEPPAAKPPEAAEAAKDTEPPATEKKGIRGIIKNPFSKKEKDDTKGLAPMTVSETPPAPPSDAKSKSNKKTGVTTLEDTKYLNETGGGDEEPPAKKKKKFLLF